MKHSIHQTIAWFKKSHPLILSFSILLEATILVIFTVFLSLGYRFAIYENVKPDWDAIGTVFSFISALGAIGAAILIPWQISQKQNRISLFNEKYDIYKKCLEFFEHWGEYVKLIMNSKSEKDRLFGCVYSIESQFAKGNNADFLISNYLESELVPYDMLAYMREIRSEGVFTFDKASCIFLCLSESDTTKITKTFSVFFDSLRISIFNKKLEQDIINKCESFQKEMDAFVSKKLVEKMKTEIGNIEV